MKSFVRKWLDSSSPPEAIQPNLPDRQRVYCIGDIHGRCDLLQELHDQIAADASEYPGTKTVVYLGDYIDRGDQSRQVVDLLLDRPLAGFEAIHLLGNHEQTLLDFLEHPNAVASWLTYGGLATLRSYGVPLGLDSGRPDLGFLRDELDARLPESHRSFFASQKLMYVAGSYCFVHAGIRPGVALQEQRNEDLLWIREEFTRSDEIHDYIVVHGHTISPEVEFRTNRIGIDTGAFHTGVLSCLVLEGPEQRLLQTGSP